MPLLRLFIFFFICCPLTVFSQGNALREELENFVQTQTQHLPGKVTYTISPLNDARPCDAFEPFIPPGNRLWGKSTLGVRCLSPSPWTIYLHIRVSVNGDYLVSTRNLPAGTLLSSSDIAFRSGELPAFPAAILTDPSQAVGKILKNALTAGQFLRGDLLTAPWAIQRGQMVRTVSSGAGFSVSSEGKALNNANEGQIVQIRTASGQIVSGIARAGGIAEIRH